MDVMDQNHQDQAWMRQAIELSRTAFYVTSPNPRVGCLIVRDGKILISGVTQRAGGPHAEAVALAEAAQAGIDVVGATLYVTLEPCSHHGRTPPCADAIIKAGIGRVVAALTDPNPQVAGQGLARLRQAGIPTQVGVCAQEALEVNPGFISRMLCERPWVWLKTAISLDGRVALSNGESQWITSQAARDDSHHWRARSCMVLTGIGTVLSDDPSLTVRAVATERQPERAVVDTRLRIPETAKMLDGGHVIVFTVADDPDKTQRLAQRNVRVVRMPEQNGRVDLAEVMRWIGQNDFNEVHVESGGRLAGALQQAGLLDELVVYMAPVLLGHGLPLATLPQFESLSQISRYVFTEHAWVGQDVRLRLRNDERWNALLQAVQG